MGAVWAPTGDQILFVSDRQDTGVRDLYLMDPDGANVRRVFKRETTAWRNNATWVPRWETVCLQLHRQVSSKFRFSISERLAKRMPNALSVAVFPDWSPDGSEIVCTVTGRLALLDVRTREETWILPMQAADWQRFPSWSAVGDKLALRL